MINFRLKDLDSVEPFGKEPNLSLSWFGLTDGYLWLKFGNETIYEYSKEAVEHSGSKSTPYVDYYLVRFIEDFSFIFDKVNETIPEELYNLTEDLKTFRSNARKWLDIYYTEEDDNDFYFDEHDKLTSWMKQRVVYASHLVGGPDIYFFRRNEKVRIVWETENILENGITLWTAKNGSCEMDYVDFIERIKVFGQSFFNEMGKQVELAIEKKWENIEIDKEKLVEEHREREAIFFAKVLLLEQEPVHKTHWVEIEKLVDRMTTEIKPG